jgi:hypothetical protein
MAVVDSVLSIKLKTIFDLMDSSAAGDAPKDNQWLANELAKAIDDQIKTAAIPAGSVVVTVTGQAAGVPNPAPINVQ